MTGPAPMVCCCICGQQWPPGDPRVLYRSGDTKWWCASGPDCDQRAGIVRQHQADVAAMYRALDAVWDQLAKDGWKWPTS